MNDKEIALRMKLYDEVSKKLGVIDGTMHKTLSDWNKNWLRNVAVMGAVVYGLKRVGDSVVGVGKDIIDTNSKFEAWQIQMEAFTESTEEAKQKLKELIDFSVKTPFTPEEVLDVAALLMPLEQAGYKLEDLLQIAGNIAASYPMTFQEAALNLNKSLSAGMGAARLFYEQGVRSHMQAISGVKDLTKVSQAELGKIFEDIYLNPSSPLSRGIKKLSKTQSGLVSTIQGEWMMFREEIGEPMFEEHKNDLQALLALISESKEEGGEYNDVVEDLRDFLKEAYDNGKDLMVSLLVGGAQLVDIWNDAQLKLTGAYAAIVKMGKSLNEWGVQSDKGILALYWNDEDVAIMQKSADLMEEELQRLTDKIIELESAANRDYSAEMEERLQKFKDLLESKKIEVRQNEEDIAQIKRETSLQTNEEDLQAFIDKENKKIEALRTAWAAWRDEQSRQQLIDQIEEEQRLQFYVETQKKAHESVWVLAGQMRDKFTSGLANSLSQFVKGAGDAKDAATELGAAMVDILIKWAVQKVVNAALSKTILAQETAASVAAAAITAQAWAPAAANVSLATFGANAVAASAGIIQTHTLSRALSIPFAEEGAIIRGSRYGSLLVAGEKGKDEAVVPLDKYEISQKGGRSIHVNSLSVYVPVQRNNMTPEEIGTAVGYEIEKYLRRGFSTV